MFPERSKALRRDGISNIRHENPVGLPGVEIWMGLKHILHDLSYFVDYMLQSPWSTLKI